jgi:hypothetical protein
MTTRTAPMHLWNPRPVAEALRADRLSEADKFRYTVAAIVMRGLIGSGAVLTAHASLGSLVTAVGALVVSVIGVRACYVRNRTGDNRGFVDRYMCLGVPVLVQTYTMYALLYYGTLAAVVFARSMPPAEAYAALTPFFWPASLVVIGFYFLRLRAFFAVASSTPAT